MTLDQSPAMPALSGGWKFYALRKCIKELRCAVVLYTSFVPSGNYHDHRGKSVSCCSNCLLLPSKRCPRISVSAHFWPERQQKVELYLKFPFLPACLCVISTVKRQNVNVLDCSVYFIGKQKLNKAPHAFDIL